MVQYNYIRFLYFNKHKSQRPIVVMPDTDWRDLSDIGWNVLSEPDEIKSRVDHIFNNEVNSNVENIYGDGKTGEKIVKLLSI